MIWLDKQKIILKEIDDMKARMTKVMKLYCEHYSIIVKRVGLMQNVEKIGLHLINPNYAELMNCVHDLAHRENEKFKHIYIHTKRKWK